MQEPREMQEPQPVLVGVDAGATTSVAIAVTADGTRCGRASGAGANPKRHGLEVAAERVADLATELVAAARPGGAPALVFVAGAGIDRPEQARALEAALGRRLDSGTRVLVVNDTLAVLRAATPDATGLAIPVSTGGNVIGRAPDGRVTDRGHGIFGGGYVLGALAMRAWRRHAASIGPELGRAVAEAGVGWRPDRPRRPQPEAARLGAAVAAAARRGDPLPARMVDRWCARVTAAVSEELVRLDLGPAPAVIVYGGLAVASPWLANRIREAVRAAAPRARFLEPPAEPAEGAAALALDAWAGRPIRWAFTPRR